MKSLICVTLVLLFSCVVNAKSVENLYDARILVEDQQPSNRKLGARKGLLEVLRKVSGFAAPQDNPVIKKAIRIADQYLYQFSYSTLSSDEQKKARPGSRWLKMRFEGKAIQRLIKSAKLPRWGSNRPSILVWLAVDKDGRNIVTDGVDHVGLKSLKEGAQKRGLPLVYPVYDLEDSIKLPIEQLWGLFSDPILAASERYAAESVLAARVFKTNKGKWKGQWRFYFKSRQYNYFFESSSLDEQVLFGLTSAGEVLANAFALKPTHQRDSNSLNIEVSNVGSLSDYAKLTKYLEDMAITKQVTVQTVKKKVLSIKLGLNGSYEQFKQALSLDQKLLIRQPLKEEEEEQEEGHPENLQTVYFDWRP